MEIKLTKKDKETAKKLKRLYHAFIVAFAAVLLGCFLGVVLFPIAINLAQHFIQLFNMWIISENEIVKFFGFMFFLFISFKILEILVSLWCILIKETCSFASSLFNKNKSGGKK